MIDDVLVGVGEDQRGGSPTGASRVPQADRQLGRRRSGARAELVDRPPVDCTRSRNSSLASTPATWVFRYHIVLDALDETGFMDADGDLDPVGGVQLDQDV